jgi:HEAT repeat protein
MSYLDERQRQLILDLLRKKLSEEAFMRAFPLDAEKRQEVAAATLNAGLASKDATDVEFGLYLGHRFGFAEQCAEALTRLLEEDWHERHEDIAFALSKIRWPGAVDALYRTTQKSYDYLAYDDSCALAVKCIWALGNIGTEAAVGRLSELLTSRNQIVRNEAQEQLERVRARAPR